MGKGKRNKANRQGQPKGRPTANGPKISASTSPAIMTAAQQWAMKDEIRRQVLIADKRYSNDFAAGVLWVLHSQFGFGPVRLRRFFEAYGKVHDQLRAQYEFDSDTDTCFVCTQRLREYGIDIDKWNEEEREGVKGNGKV